MGSSAEEIREPCEQKHMPEEVPFAEDNDVEEMGAAKDAEKDAQEAVEPKSIGPTVEIGFMAQDNERKVVTVTSAKLGVQYSSWSGKVTSVRAGGVGEECGITVGWKVVDIDGVHVSNMNFIRKKQVIRQALARLPSS